MKRVYQKLNIILIFLFVVAFLLTTVGSVFAQETIKVVEQSWDADFRDHLTFTLSAESPAQIVEVNLFYQVVGQIASSRNEADFTPGTSIKAEFTIDQTDPTNYLPPGTELQYWWKIVDAAGNELKTEKETLLYLDNRHDWKTLESERLALYWYEGSDSFGKKLFDRANLALDTLETDVGVRVENPIKIFIYASHEDLLDAISTGAQEWTGGQTFARYGVVVMGIHPSQLQWGLNATTHEITHLVIHQATENPFGDLPRWLDEGIAVYNENRDQLDDDFRPIFERAVKNNELMTLRTLSSPFPSDPLKANLAYGQSGAVVKFIIDTYGPEAMAKLLNIFAEGALYDEALKQALGVDTDGLDNTFRASLGLPPLPGTANNAAAAAESSQEQGGTTGPETAAQEGVVPQQPVVTVKPAESGAAASSTPAAEGESSPLTLPCLAGILPLVALALVTAVKRTAT